MDKIQIEVFTDGSSSQSKFAGIGVFFPEYDDYCVSKSFKNMTNQQMELQACYEGIIKFIEIMNDNHFEPSNCELIIYTDSMYTINCMTVWCLQWKKYGWKKRVGNILKNIKNVEIIKEIYKLSKNYSIKYVHVRGHQKQPDASSTYEKRFRWEGNRMADKLAVDAMIMEKYNLNNLDNLSDEV